MVFKASVVLLSVAEQSERAYHQIKTKIFHHRSILQPCSLIFCSKTVYIISYIAWIDSYSNYLCIFEPCKDFIWLLKDIVIVTCHKVMHENKHKFVI